MKKIILSAVILFMPYHSIAQCTKDSECKGTRICSNGTCVEAPTKTSTTSFSSGTSQIEPSVLNGGFQLLGGLSRPTGDFADDDASDEDAGFVASGFAAGFRVSKIMSPGVYWLFDVMGLFNPMVDEMEENLKDGGAKDIETGWYISIPTLAGIKGQISLSPSIAFYGLGELGAALIMHTTGEYKKGGTKIEQSYDPTFNFIWGFGGGIMFNNKFDICLRFINMGEPKIEGKVKSNDSTVEIDRRQEISYMTITAGIQF